MSNDYQTKPSTGPAPIATKTAAPAPVPKDPGSAPMGRWSVRTPPKIEIVGRGIGQSSTFHDWIAVTMPLADMRGGFGPAGPQCQVTLERGDALKLRSAPTAMPVAETAQMRDETYAINLDFKPEVDAVYQDTLVIQLLEDGQEYRIPILALTTERMRGVAHPAPAPKKIWPAPSPTHAPESPKGTKKPPAVKPDAKPGSRLIAIATEHDFDEQVVGSHQAAQITAPTNIGAGQAIAYFTVVGDGFSLASTPQLTLAPASGMSADDAISIGANSPKIVYAPRAPQHHQGQLKIVVVWGDGVRAHQTVLLRGRARTLEQAPGHEKTAAEIQHEAEETKQREEMKTRNDKAIAAEDVEQRHNPQAPDFKFEAKGGVVDQAEKAAYELAMEQSAGCDVVEKEAGAYKKIVENAERSIWLDLAEVALNMATAGLASSLAKNVLPAILGASTKKILAVEGVETFAYVLQTTPAKFSEFTTDALKDGMKAAGKKAIKTVLDAAGSHGGSEATGADGASSDGGELSANRRIDFFAKQSKVLREQAANNQQLILDRFNALRPIHRVAPERSIAIMEAIRDGFATAKTDAMNVQANYLAPQWAAFLARAQLGSDRVGTANPKDTTKVLATKTASLHPTGARGLPKPIDGVLDILVPHDFPPATIQAARLHGASKSLAKRLTEVPLLDAKMPIRFVLGTNSAAPTIVTRDEAGRVRVSGNYANVARFGDVRSQMADQKTSEADAIAGAMVMIEQLASRSLKDYGIAITTDDSTAPNGVGQ